MRFPVVLLALTLLAAEAIAQSGPTASTTSTAATTATTDLDMALLEKLLREHPSENFAVQHGFDPHVTPATPVEIRKLPVAIYGRLQSGSISDTDKTIRDFAAKYGTLMGIPAGQDPLAGLRQFRTFEQPGGARWIQYCRRVGDLDYVSQMMTYAFRENGELCAVVGRFTPAPSVSGSPLSREEAIRIAQEAIIKKFPYEQGNINGPVKIAECLMDDWENYSGARRLIAVTMDVGEPATPKRVLMQSDGTVLWTEDAKYQGCSGFVFKQDPETDAESLTKIEMPDIVKPLWYKSYVIDGKNIKVDSPMAPSRTWTFIGRFKEDPFSPDPHEKFAEINVYYHLTQSWAKAIEGGLTEKEMAPFTPLYYDHWRWPECYHLEPSEEITDPAERKKMDDEAIDCRTQQQNNAWFSSATHRLYFASENSDTVRKTVDGVASEKHPGYEATVIAHEFGHWVHYILSPHHNLTGSVARLNEARALAEGVADIFAAIVCDNPVIGTYFLEKNKRDLNGEVKLTDVVPIRDRAPTKDEKGTEFHDASRAFTTAYWKIKGDMGALPALKVLIAGMRMCHTPSRFQAMALAALAADQMLSLSPQGLKMAERFSKNQMVQGAYAIK